MLDRVDRMQLAVRDRAAAAATFTSVLGALQVREDEVAAPLNCKRTVVQAGDSEFELLEPAGEGPVAEHLERWGEGIFAAGFSSPDLPEIARRMEDTRLHFTYQGSQVFIAPDQTRGMRTVLQSPTNRDRVGLISGLYEVTNVVADHEEASKFYSGIFGLDRSRFSPINSGHWGYGGTLTMFDPPTKLDRIEITQTNDAEKSMGKFFGKRGDSIYMCFAEAPDLGILKDRLDAMGARYTPAPEGPGSLFIHPTALCGMLLGISATNEAWRWSGRPDLAPASA